MKKIDFHRGKCDRATFKDTCTYKITLLSNWWHSQHQIAFVLSQISIYKAKLTCFFKITNSIQGKIRTG